MSTMEEKPQKESHQTNLNLSTSEDAYLSDEEEFNRQYDLTPVSEQQNPRTPSGHSIDPWEALTPTEKEAQENQVFFQTVVATKTSSSEETGDTEDYPDREYSFPETQYDQGGANSSNRSSHPTFLVPSDIHPNMEQREEDIAQLRLIAGNLNADWGCSEYMAPQLARRIRDFQFAQEKRRKKYGDERPWGILGLYEHLSAIR
jgi:hypothetical protein